MTENITYSLHEVKDDPRESVIKQEGGVSYFSLAQTDAEFEKLDKLEIEAKAKIELEQVRMDNVKEHHPEIVEMDEVKMSAAHMYFNAKATVDALNETLERVVEQREHLQKEVDKAIESTGVLEAKPEAPKKAAKKATKKVVKETKDDGEGSE